VSYQLYVAGGYGFTERILPSLLHPSDAVSIAQDYFSRGYQGAHIEPPPDGGYRALEQSSSSERQVILDALQSGQLVLGRLDSAAFGIFTKRTASPEHLRSDLPASLASRLRDRWPTGGSAGPAVRSDSLHAPASQNYQFAPEPVAEPVPGKGPYSLTIEYRWPDGTGVANLPFKVGTDLESVTGVLDHQGAASVEGLHGRFATVRLGSSATDDVVRQERKTIIAGLHRLLEQERKDYEARETVYQQMPGHEKALVSTGAVFQGAYDAGIGLFDFVVGVSDLANPTNTLMDGLKSAWSANQENGASSWYETFNNLYDDKRRERWVRAIGFSPSDISREDIAKAYELASLVMTDDQLNAALKDFATDYAAIQHHTEYAYIGGAIAFELVLAGLLAATTLGAGNAAQASSRIRHARILAGLGPAFGRFVEALKLQGLRKIWRDFDLNRKNRFEAEASPRPKGVDPDPVQLSTRPGKVRPRSFNEAKKLLGDARNSIIANGKAPSPKYTQAQLHHIAQEGFADEKFIVRLVEEPHVHRNGPNNGTLGKEGPAGVQIWSTSFDQIAHLDTDPKLITEAMGVNYKPDAKYKLAIIDQADAVRYADAETIVPTYGNLTKFVEDKLPGKVENPALTREVMTPEYSREYEALIRGMPDDAWVSAKLRKQYLADNGVVGNEKALFDARFSIQDNTGANEHFTGNGLTKTASSTADKPIYGTVEAFSLHKNPKTFRQMTGMEGSGAQWVELVDLEPINFGA
jgi:hypothetical protein